MKLWKRPEEPTETKKPVKDVTIPGAPTERQPVTEYLGTSGRLRQDAGELLRQDAAELLMPAAERQLLRELLGGPGQDDWDKHAGLARFRKGLEKLRSDPAEQRRIDQIIEAVPPDKPFSGPLAKESLSQPSGMDVIDNSVIYKPPAKSHDNPIIYKPPAKDLDNPVIKATPKGLDDSVIYKPPAKGEFGKDKVDSKNQFGKGKTTK